MNGSMYINIFTAIVSVVMGVLLISGVVLQNLDLNSRLVFGVVFAGYGIYRFLTVQTKRKALKQEKEHERIKRAQEQLIKNQHKEEK